MRATTLPYAPEMGYRFQILVKYKVGHQSWEHCDYARDQTERNYLLHEYAQAYGPDFQFKSIQY